MKRLLSALLACPVLLSAFAGAADPDKMLETPYCPLQVGNTWHYKINGNKFSYRVTKHEKVGDVLCARLEMTRDGKVVAWQHLGVTAGGLFRYDLEEQQDGKAVRQTPKPPILLLPLAPKRGDTFKVDSQADGKTFRGAFKIGEAPDVKVPAGTYKTISVASQDLEANALKPTITTYYASGVGMVKQVIEESGSKAEVELEKFEPAAK